MTKAEHIRALYDGVRTTREIAKIVGCNDSYVRVCARQRVPGGHDANKYYQSRINASAKRFGDRAKARKAWREKYRELRNQGVDSRAATSIAGGCYSNELRKTCVTRLTDLARQN